MPGHGSRNKKKLQPLTGRKKIKHLLVIIRTTHTCAHIYKHGVYRIDFLRGFVLEIQIVTLILYYVYHVNKHDFEFTKSTFLKLYWCL